MVATRNETVVVGVFEDREKARECVAELRRAGFTDSEIGVAARSDSTAAEGRITEEGSAAGTGAATGIAAGAGIGALWALGIVAGFLPAIGPAIAGGILGSLLTSAVAGAAAGGLIGALMGLGIPEEEAKYYEDEFRAGRTIVTVKSEKNFAEAQSILRRYGAYDMQTKYAGAGSAAAGKTTAAEARMSAAATCPPQTQGSAASLKSETAVRGDAGATVKVHEEKLTPRKQAVETGEVRIHKDVITEQKTLEVPVTREEIVIERRPASGAASTTEIREGQEIRIPVKEEQVHLEKQAVVTEEVSVGKRKVQDTETVSGTVRKEQVRVDEQGDVTVKGNTRPRTP